MATADTIAVKCPGCQAGFDVPTSLAGKTIRCTSCKTQLPVPAPGGRARSAADGLPTAKSASSRPSNGPPGKSAAAMLPRGGKPNRPRDDDDDDDEDDEDDRPARRGKKKKAASGSAMPLILGVVGVLVLAGGGVGAYFMFKKDAPATASNSSGGGTTPDGGPKGGPPRGMAPPGGDGTTTPPPGDGTTAPTPGAVASDGWVTHKGNGYTVDFPSGVTPVRKSESGPNGIGVSGLLDRDDDTKAALGVMVLSFPPPASLLQPQAMLDLFLEGISKEGRGAAGGKSEITQKTAATVDGHPAYFLTMRAKQKNVTIQARLVAAHGKVFFAMCGNEDASTLAKADRFLGSLRILAPESTGQQVAANTPEGGPPGRPGFTRPGDTGLTPGGTTPMGGPPPGMTFPMGGPMAGGVTLPMGGPPPGMALPMGGLPPGMTFPMGGPPPGVTVPGAPPPPPGGTPMFGPPPGAVNPGGGTPGFAGSSGGGGYNTPPLGAQIDPFFTIAFDADKSDVFTVSAQAVGGKAVYKLNRYSYPAFILKGSWKVPSLGVRSAIDTTNGKLYVATTPLTASLFNQQKGDRNAGAGDVAVYDLAGLRDGKLKDQAELKPAVIATGNKVYGLDVSPDGKVLTVLTTRTGAKGKAALRQYGTADRKMVKEKDLPNAPWDLARSGDKLYVVEDPRSAAGQVVLQVNPATLESEPVRLPNGTTDVAYAPDGKLVAAAGAAGGSAGDLTVLDAGAPKKVPAVTASRKNQNGYARFTADGKKLLVSSHGLEPQFASLGLDVYDVADPADPSSYKRVATVRSSGLLYVGGYFHLSPDGEWVVIQSSGAVIETAKLAEHLVGPEPPGLNGGGGGGPGELGPMGPGGVGPGGPPMGPGRGGFGPPPGNQPGAAPPMVPGPPGAAPPFGNVPMAPPGIVPMAPGAAGGAVPMAPPGGRPGPRGDGGR